MMTNDGFYDDITDAFDWVAEPPDDIYAAMNAALDSRADLREDCD